MTSGSISRRFALLATIASSLLLASCGGGGSSGGGSASIRVLNLTSDTPSVDLFFGTTKQFSAQRTSVLSNYSTVDANNYSLSVNAEGSTAVLFPGQQFTLSKDAHYTAIVWGNQSSTRLTTLPEDEDTRQIASGNTRVRMFNATTETGAFDVYISAAAADISASTPTQAAVAAGGLSSYREIAGGTYRLRITGVGDTNDIRLDIPAITLVAGQYATIVYTPGGSGVLVNGTQIAQQGARTALPNTKARVRVVASVDNGGSVGATVGATTLAAGLRSPLVGPYALVDAGTVNVSMRVNGVTFSSGSRTLLAGSDYTLMALGTAAAPQLVSLTDDNRLPVSNTRSKLRLVNGIGNGSPLTLSVDYSPVAVDIVSGTASSYSTAAVLTSLFVQVTSPTATLFQSTTLNPVNLAAQSVYTVFMLSGNTDSAGAASPTGVIRKER